MRKFTLLSTVLLAVTTISCKENKQETDTAPSAETKAYAQLEKASWLVGLWGTTSPEGSLTESWTKANDSVYNGATHFVVGKDTVFSESIRLEEAGGKLTYVTAVSDQNDGQPIRFGMSSMDDKTIVFENPQHDFPQKITYNKISNDSLVAVISGMQNGKPATETFPMKRRK